MSATDALRAAAGHLRPLPVGSPRRRAAVAAAATAVAAAVPAVAVAAAPADLRTRAAVAGVVGVVLLAAAALRWPVLLTPALLALGTAALVPIARDDDEAWIEIAAAVLLVLAAELAGWAADLRSVAAEQASLARLRLLRTVGLASGAGALAGVLLLVARLRPPGGALPIVLGGAATLALVAFVALRRWSADDPSGAAAPPPG